MLRDLRDGFAFMLRTPWLLWTLLFASLFVLVVLGPIEVLLPFIAKERFADGEQTYGFILAFFGMGSALGALAVSSRRLPRRYLTVMMTMWSVGSFPLMVVGVTSSFPLMAFATFVIGATDGAGMVIWGTLLQRRVPTEMLGRVSSLDFFVSLASCRCRSRSSARCRKSFQCRRSFWWPALLRSSWRRSPSTRHGCAETNWPIRCARRRKSAARR